MLHFGLPTWIRGLVLFTLAVTLINFLLTIGSSLFGESISAITIQFPFKNNTLRNCLFFGQHREPYMNAVIPFAESGMSTEFSTGLVENESWGHSDAQII